MKTNTRYLAKINYSLSRGTRVGRGGGAPALLPTVAADASDDAFDATERTDRADDGRADDIKDRPVVLPESAPKKCCSSSTKDERRMSRLRFSSKAVWRAVESPLADGAGRRRASA